CSEADDETGPVARATTVATRGPSTFTESTSVAYARAVHVVGDFHWSGSTASLLCWTGRGHAAASSRRQMRRPNSRRAVCTCSRGGSVVVLGRVLLDVSEIPVQSSAK